MSIYKYGNFVDGVLLLGPMDLPNGWEGPNQEKYTGLNTLEINNPSKLLELNWYIMQEDSVEFNPDYEEVIYSSWYLENNIIKRDYVKLFHNFELALSIAFNKLDKNRERYEISGLPYVYSGIDVIVLTDKESSQGKLVSSKTAATPDSNLIKDRLDTDVWKFGLPNGGFLVVQLSNLDLLDICSFVFRKFQDAYNLTSAIAWQMLAAGNTENLMNSINNGNILLNPWSSTEDTPWQMS